jgi:hypothetical protein
MSSRRIGEIGLEFLPNSGGEAEGLGDAGIETFRDKPFAAVARETGQNSRDAQDTPGLPVRITFDQIEVPTSEFPSIGEFLDAARRCLEKAEKRKSEKDIGFFRQAVAALSARKIQVMRVSDFNTKGVRGPCEEGSPFHTLAKADGMSVKEDKNSGGSFGIGKSAVSALSDIQTAFYSTLYNDDAGSHVLCMGKTLFISHTGADGGERRRKGYWGRKQDFMPIDKITDIPDWLQRQEQGTSIFSICVRENRIDWRYEMLVALLVNFFAAILRSEMEFEIDGGSIRLNKNTIETYFADPEVGSAVDQLKSRAAFETARRLYECLVDEKATMHMLTVPGLGVVNMRVLLREGLTYTIGIVRNGMFITDNFANFGESFKRFPLHKEFAVAIEPAGPVEGEWFKRLENPSHNDLSAERITDPALRQQGQRAFEKLAKDVRNKIRELAKSEPTHSVELEELNEFFASDETRSEDELGKKTDPQALKPTPVRVSVPKPRRRVRDPNGEEEDGPAVSPEPNDEPPEPNLEPNPTPGPLNRRRLVSEPIDLEKERNQIPDPWNKRRRRLFFTSPVNGVVNLSVEASGLSNNEQLVISSANVGSVIGGKVVLTCKRGERVSVELEFLEEYIGPIELNAVRIQVNDEDAAA